MSSDWMRTEVEAIVADYFDMLESELKGKPYSKAAHRRRLLPLLNNRSEGSIERKHMNISAVLISLGFPYIDGYKPYGNYQRMLYEVVAERISGAKSLVKTVAADVEEDATVPSFDDILKCLVKPPKTEQQPSRVESPGPRVPYEGHRNYLEIEARNALLGSAGEEYALRFEQARLVTANQENLASRIEHTSKTRGDGAGYDILSFETDGRERLVEVKTTRYGELTPFFLSKNEVAVSAERDELYHLYRLFSFRKAPKLFVLDGSLQKNCRLEPQNYLAKVA